MKHPPALLYNRVHKWKKKKEPQPYCCKVCIVVVRTPLVVEHGCTRLVLHKKKRLKKVTVLNALKRTCLNSLFRPT